jgi:hypothetical protein
VWSLAQTRGREGGGGVVDMDERARRGKRAPGSAPPFLQVRQSCGDGGKGTKGGGSGAWHDVWRQEKQQEGIP